MAASAVLLKTPYGRRVELVKAVIQDKSKLDDDQAREIAVHVLHALDSIPEKMR
ncbi:DUF6307 family protein [Mycolicibacterium sediminis]|uniref:Uncharacterized protein n=1 Tax=Mycolicibacterium sediminis TaxID=1286180 RepID=A0A7I7QPD9_9MYCO|nr:DUF6307 family protein [Mycolicibacterium sediminis]BBY28181.1 hypothetical protein MSEDJ_22770 [Mycolicibacterium sediminis]